MIYRLWTSNGKGKIHLKSGYATLCGTRIEIIGHAYSHHLEIGHDGSLIARPNLDAGMRADAVGIISSGTGAEKADQSIFCPDCIISAWKEIGKTSGRQLPGETLFDF